MSHGGCGYCETVPRDFQHPRHVTIRPATRAERKSYGTFWATGANLAAKRWLVVDAADPSILLGAFGMADSADTKEEAVFWAERVASKNGWGYLSPKGWEAIVGDLPEHSA